MKSPLLKVVAACACLMSSGCAQTIIEWDVKTGKLVDRGTGYYAYSTDLPARNPQEVRLSLASRANLENERTFESGAATAVYPRIAYDPVRVYVRPEALGAYLPSSGATDTAPGDTLVLGYFMTWIGAQKHKVFEGKELAGATEGISWVDLSDGAGREFTKMVQAVQAQAGRVGAHAVVDLAVFWSDHNAPYDRDSGLFLTGRAIAVGHIARE